ncbi:ABC transporter substrate-binding protein [Pontibacillus yanchengensis]|uniref:ABC transporter substrate-binding protein n=1 Tax=Pontibacillus yanchengensis Y32 TaxID=1385514 RepID=A0A0A2TD81_9BACI|nr:ABC transporter substrate-binding protein [Pontibacillus yanchengensis]KGP73792.1 ABC transporter substrate-binding protein [Pontibacillus yanchengensis Y32]
MLDQRYFTMRAHLYEREHNQICTFKLQELEDIWYCSTKNVKRILHELEAQERLVYQPGRGRGNPSTLQFLSPFQSEVDHYVKNCLHYDQLDKAAQLLRLPIPKSWIAKSSSDIRKMFGYQSDTASKDILHAFITRDVMTLDPLRVAISFEAHLLEQLGDALLTYDAQHDVIRPHIAHRYEVDETYQVWTFHLRKSVQFHHREELTSRDVEATLIRVQQGPISTSWMTQEIVNIECQGPYKIVITLSKPNPFFARYMASSNLCILPADTPFDEYEWIGTGPFFMKERTEHKLVLEAFDSYFKERPLLDEVHFYKVSPEVADVVNFTIDSPDLSEPQSKHEIETGFRFLTFNFQQDNIVQQPDFREAIFHLLDMNKMAKALQWENWVEASSFMAHRSEHLPKDSQRIPHLLKKAGYKGETLRLYHLNFERAKREVDWFADEARKYGISFELHPFTFKDFYEKNMDPMIDLIFMGEVSSLDPHLSFLGAFYNDTLLFRRMFPENALTWIDAELEELKKQMDASAREAIMARVEAYIRNHNLLIFQHHPVKTRTFHPLIQNVEFQSFGHFDLTKLWIPN